jgi:hypothetical protein
MEILVFTEKSSESFDAYSRKPKLYNSFLARMILTVWGFRISADSMMMTALCILVKVDLRSICAYSFIALTMEAIRTSESSVHFHVTKLCYIAESSVLTLIAVGNFSLDMEPKCSSLTSQASAILRFPTHLIPVYISSAYYFCNKFLELLSLPAASV